MSCFYEAVKHLTIEANKQLQNCGALTTTTKISGASCICPYQLCCYLPSTRQLTVHPVRTKAFNLNLPKKLLQALLQVADLNAAAKLLPGCHKHCPNNGLGLTVLPRNSFIQRGFYLLCFRASTNEAKIGAQTYAESASAQYYSKGLDQH